MRNEPLRRCSTAKMYHCGVSGASVHNAPVLHGLAESREDDVRTHSSFDAFPEAVRASSLHMTAVHFCEKPECT